MPLGPDAYDPHTKTSRGLSIVFPEKAVRSLRRDEVRTLAEVYATVVAVDALHEAFEWVKVDGERIAEPHPGGPLSGPEWAMWDWLASGALDVVTEYQRRWPVGPRIGH